MKKKALKRWVRGLEQQLAALRAEMDKTRSALAAEKAASRKLAEEAEQMRTHWRPVPITHEWIPRNPQCALCDEPRDSARHAS
jgi:septal ring factor EnvC (AmiA/AmiB activator)